MHAPAVLAAAERLSESLRRAAAALVVEIASPTGEPATPAARRCHAEAVRRVGAVALASVT